MTKYQKFFGWRLLHTEAKTESLATKFNYSRLDKCVSL
jgi:hypothetical protein